MENLSIERCRELIGDDASGLTDEQIQRLRRELYGLANIVIDAFCGLDVIDQSLFSPPGDIIDQLNAGMGQA